MLWGSSRWCCPSHPSSNEPFLTQSMRPCRANESRQSDLKWLPCPFMSKWQHWTEFVSHYSKRVTCFMLGHMHTHTCTLSQCLITFIEGRGGELRGPLRGTEETMKGFKKAIDLPGTAKPSLSVYVMGREKVRSAEREEEEEEEDRLTEKDTARRRRKGGTGWD